MADENGSENQDANKGGKKKLIIMILVGVLLGGAGIGGSLYFTGMLGGGKKDAAVEEHEKETKTVPIYFAFPQPFTVNFETETGLRFLQVNLELMSYDMKAIEAVETHMPAIKNNIILLLSNQAYGDLVSLEGKAKLRERAQEEIQAILDKYAEGSKIEEVYFTNFVMQ